MAQKIIIHKPHRKLLRTQNSLQKMMGRNPDSHVKNMKKLMHRQLKDSLINSIKINSFEVTTVIDEQLTAIKKKVKSKNKSYSNIFKNAHLITSSESFIKPKKNRKTIEKEFLEKRLMYQTYSQKRLQAQQASFNKIVVSNSAIKAIEQKQCQSTIEKEDLDLFRKISKNNQAGCSQPVDKNAKSKKKAYSRHLRVYSQGSSAKFQAQLSVPTVRVGKENNQESGSNNVVYNPYYQLNGDKEPFSQLSQIEIQRQRRQLSQEQKEELKTIQRKPVIKSELNLLNVESQNKSPDTIDSKEENLHKIQRKKSNNKYYQEEDCINNIKIQQLQLQTIESVDNKKKKNGRSKILGSQILNNPYLPWESSIKENTQLNEPHVQDKSAFSRQTKQSPTKKKQIKVKSTPKIIQSKQQHNRTNNFAEKTILNEILSDQQSQKTENLEIQQIKQKQGQQKTITNMISKQIPTNLQQKSKLGSFKPNLLQIKQKTKKINQLKEQLQLFSEMATYFSKKSKYFKQGNQSGQFLREKVGLKWHKLIFLFFKLASFNLLLIEAYFKWVSTFINVKQGHLAEFSSQNKIWAQTLFKVQKSVRKNMQISNSDEWIELNFPEIKEQSIDLIMDEILILKNGNSQCYKYMASMTNIIFDQTAILLKSVFISKFLKENSEVSTSFREGIMRVVNSCIILEGFFRNRQHIKLQPITKLQELENTTLEKFKQLYNKLIHQIFCK